MIQINYKRVKDHTFNAAMKKLSAKPFRDQKLAYTIAKIVNVLNKEAETTQALFLKLVDTYADKDAQGHVIVPPGMAPGSFQVSKNHEEYQKALADFEALSFDIPGPKLTFLQLESVDLSAEDCIALEPLLEGEPA